ncbi:MAG TPA: magnesium/cobalt transporter CorA [Thermomicrobiales bacterium]|nr:magnesium/cobalt transporter CorA [Thermomicrobiales bacterium]
MISVHVHTDGQGLQTSLPLERISDVLDDAKSLLWVDVVDPTPDDLRLLGEEFRFHPLAMEDATKRHQRPKIDFYDGFLFIVFYELEIHHARPETRELTLFVGKNYLVTVHDGAFEVVKETARRWRENVHLPGDRGVGLLVYSLLDAVVDGYFPIIDELSERIEDMEQAIFERSDQRIQQEIFMLKRDLLAIRRVLGPERDVMNVLVRRDSPVFEPGTIVYFQDIYDHLLRVMDAVDTYRDLLTGALDAYFTVTSNRLNQVVKTLTASSIILMSMTLVAGIYGMNFVYMPELHWLLGYPWALGLMVAVGAGLFIMFRRIDWF